MDRYSRGYDERRRSYNERPRSDTYRPGENYRPERDSRDSWDPRDNSIRGNPQSTYILAGQGERSADPYLRRHRYQESRGNYPNIRTHSPVRSRSRSPRRSSYIYHPHRTPPASRRSPSATDGRRDLHEHRLYSPSTDSDHQPLQSRHAGVSGPSGSYRSPPRRHYNDSSRSPITYHNREHPLSATQSRSSISTQPSYGSGYSGHTEMTKSVHVPGAISHAGFGTTSQSRIHAEYPQNHSHGRNLTTTALTSNTPLRPRLLWAPDQEKELEQCDIEIRKHQKEETNVLSAVRKTKFELAWAEWDATKSEHYLALVQKQWEENRMNSVLEEAI